MPRNEIDPSLITNKPRKWKLASYVTNKDNISADKDETVKWMKCTMNPGKCQNKLTLFLLITILKMSLCPVGIVQVSQQRCRKQAMNE